MLALTMFPTTLDGSQETQLLFVNAGQERNISYMSGSDFFFCFFPKNRVGTIASWLRPDKNYFGSPYLCFLPNSCYCSGMSRSFALNMTQSHTIKL